MENLDILGSPVIAFIVYWFVNMLKFGLKKTKFFEAFKQFIPLVSAVSGALLGIAAYYIAPEILPASNVFVAILAGGASGLAATGCHQIFKQLGKCKCDNEAPSDSGDNMQN